MKLIQRIGLPFAALLVSAAAAPPPPPAELYGELFEAVQLGRVFGDGKTFVDAVPKRPPAAILADYRESRPLGRDELERFVRDNFQLPEPPPAPPSIDVDRPIDAHIAALWPVLTRPPLDPPQWSSAIALPEPYVVPGGRFREIYYWDSYFTMLGLKEDGEHALIEGMLADFESLLERFGRIPNGTRTYYLSRSQPPFFALMLDLSAGDSTSLSARRGLAALRTEHAFWMRGTQCLGAAPDRESACERVVRMPDGSLLNRYWDDRETPRDESYAEDVATAQASERPAAEVYRDLRAGAESGWDFSSRWLDDTQSLESVRTTRIVPIDLNSLLWSLETNIARRCGILVDLSCASEFTVRASERRMAMDRYLWVAGEKRFADWDSQKKKVTPVLSAATLYPLFVGLATPQQAAAVAETTRSDLLATGGLRTTLSKTGQQWDSPNGWAPLQWVAVAGLGRYGHEELARDIAERFLETTDLAYRNTGKMLEKYDVEQRRPGGGGEYPVQDGFGWTNGVVRALMARYPDAAATERSGEFPAESVAQP